jgi:large subunit ribosomal protein L17
MKHGKKILKIGRNASHRKATLQSMSAALLEHKRITTTFGKAKALRRFVEPIITHAKDDSTHSRRQAFRKLNDKEAVKTLYDEVAGMVGDRPGGYTRVVKLGQRGGDAAEMAIVELVDFNDVKPEGASGTKKKTRRSRRRKGNNTAPTVSEPAAETLAPAEAETAPAEGAPAQAADQPAET